MKIVKIAVLGLGTVGTGVNNILREKQKQIEAKMFQKTGQKTRIEIKKALVRDLNREYGIEKNILTDNYDEILNDPEIKIIVELIGGQSPATEYMIKAMEKGKHIVTANKMAIALSKGELEKVAENSNVKFMFEASVAGTIPVIRTIQDSLVANEIKGISGIINGSTNYILTKMAQEGQSFEEALEDAKKLGYVEANPSSDVDGYDAMYKLAILSKLSFGEYPDFEKIDRTGITGVSIEDIKKAKLENKTIKFIAQAKRTTEGIKLLLAPTALENSHPLANVNGALNAVYIECDNSGEIMLQGAGAGSRPTASAVVSDIFAIAQDL